MQAIETKFLGPTDSNYNNRIKATAAAGSIIIDWDDNHSIEDNHKYAAEMLCNKFNWPWVEHLIGGQLKSGSYVWVYNK